MIDSDDNNEIINENINDISNFVNMLTKLPCMTKEWRPVIPNRKDVYLTPDQLKVAVLNSTKINRILDMMTNNQNENKDKLIKATRLILDEIGYGKSLPIIRWLGICISAVVKRVCSAIYINEKSFEKVKNTIGNHPVLYLPSHRSYADFILMSYLCFTYNLEIPAIAAGMDFHGMVGMGSILRKTGAFFMRRSFSTDKLYWSIFKEYVHYLVTISHIGIEFFIEGTRSRSCKALSPKIGLLSMALEPLFMGEVSDITIVPIGISYDKPLEEALFVYELLGIPKPKESTLGLVKSLSIIEQRYGNIYFNFGEPMSAKEYFGNKLNRIAHSNIPSNVQKLNKNELIMINDLAYEVVNRQQNLIVLSTFNLMCIYYNYSKYLSKMITLNDMTTGILWLGNILKINGALVEIDENNVNKRITETLNVHSNIMKLTSNNDLTLIKPNINLKNMVLSKLKGHNLSEATMNISVPVFGLQLYNNPGLFWMSRSALMILVGKKLLKSNFIDNKLLKDQLYSNIQILRNLFALDFVYQDNRHEADFESTINYLYKLNIFTNDETDYDNNLFIKFNNTSEYINIFLSIVAPFFCCYLEVARIILNEFSSKEFTEQELFKKVQSSVEIKCLRKENIHPYCLSLESINLALQSFYNNQCVTKVNRNQTVLYSSILNKILDVEVLLNEYCEFMPYNYTNFNQYAAKL